MESIRMSSKYKLNYFWMVSQAHWSVPVQSVWKQCCHSCASTSSDCVTVMELSTSLHLGTAWPSALLCVKESGLQLPQFWDKNVYLNVNYYQWHPFFVVSYIPEYCSLYTLHCTNGTLGWTPYELLVDCYKPWPECTALVYSCIQAVGMTDCCINERTFLYVYMITTMCGEPCTPVIHCLWPFEQMADHTNVN